MNICQGRVVCAAEPTKSTTTTSSNEVMKAKSAPEITPGQDQGHLHLEEGGHRVGAEVRRGAHQAAVEADERRGHGDDDEGDAEHGMGEDDAPVGALQAEARVEESTCRPPR